MNTLLVILVVFLILAIYGGMHYYLYRKLRWIFPHHGKLLILVVFILSISLLLIHILADSGLSLFLSPLAWFPSVWLGFVFLFFAIAGTVDVILWLLSRFHCDKIVSRIKPRATSLLTGGMTMVVCIIGYFSAQQVAIHSQILSSAKLNQSVKVVQISDLHLSLLSQRQQIEKLVERVNALHPDIIVSTGDLVDMQSEHLDGFSESLAGLKATLGKYAIYGNHEAFAGPEQSKVFIEKSGFELLSHRSITVGAGINIVGVDDPAVHRRITTAGDEVKEATLLSQLSSQRFTLLLKHQPVVSAESRGLFDLQLSGHTHGGQIFPFGLLVSLVYRAPQGLSQVTPNSWLYVSNGTGTWGPPMRVLAEPEITVFYLQPK